MRNRNPTFVGCDIGDKFTELCVVDPAGAVIEARRVRTTKPALVQAIQSHRPARVVIEAGTHSRWVEEALTDAGHEVLVANPRQIRLIWKRKKKTDRTDANLLARLARVDVALLAPVHQRSPAAQVDLAVLRSRDLLVSTRTRLVNHVRGTLKQFGLRVPSCSPAAFVVRAEEIIPATLEPALRPVLEALRGVEKAIRQHDEEVERLFAASSTAQKLAEIDAVGPITSLAFTLIIETPNRFTRSRIVGAFIGLTPAKDQSGDSDPQKRISKMGDGFLRRLLVQCAHRLLGPFGGDCDLRRWGLALCARGGAAARKRAIVAVARKLAVVMHRIWVTGRRYDPHFATAAA
ncbi:MAG TPA: IS110 family transposase [Anaeromyxobacter sp.]|nr:IS110 family transposase [Anaeromyxobacter sp.]